MPLPNDTKTLPKGNPLDGPPPLPPQAPPAQQNQATYGKLVPQGQPMPQGSGQPGMDGMQPATPGGSQISEKVIQIGYEVEMALKTLAQAVPQLGPWVMQVVPELRTQLGQALSSGLSSSPVPQGNSQMPDGSGNL